MKIEAGMPTINPTFKLVKEIPKLASKASNAGIQQQGNIKLTPQLRLTFNVFCRFSQKLCFATTTTKIVSLTVVFS